MKIQMLKAIRDGMEQGLEECIRNIGHCFSNYSGLATSFYNFQFRPEMLDSDPHMLNAEVDRIKRDITDHYRRMEWSKDDIKNNNIQWDNILSPDHGPSGDKHMDRVFDRLNTITDRINKLNSVIKHLEEKEAVEKAENEKIKRIEELTKQNEETTRELDFLKLHLKYMPHGLLYEDAKKDFEGKAESLDA